MHIFDSLVSLLFKQEIKGILDNVMVPFFSSFVLQLVFVGAALIIFMYINLASNKRLESIWFSLLALFNKSLTRHWKVHNLYACLKTRPVLMHHRQFQKQDIWKCFDEPPVLHNLEKDIGMCTICVHQNLEQDRTCTLCLHRHFWTILNRSKETHDNKENL